MVSPLDERHSSRARGPSLKVMFDHCPVGVPCACPASSRSADVLNGSFDHAVLGFGIGVVTRVCAATMVMQITLMISIATT
jgi:hypothetical protein